MKPWPPGTEVSWSSSFSKRSTTTEVDCSTPFTTTPVKIRRRSSMNDFGVAVPPVDALGLSGFQLAMLPELTSSPSGNAVVRVASKKRVPPRRLLASRASVPHAGAKMAPVSAANA